MANTYWMGNSKFVVLRRTSLMGSTNQASTHHVKKKDPVILAAEALHSSNPQVLPCTISIVVWGPQ